MMKASNWISAEKCANDANLLGTHTKRTCHHSLLIIASVSFGRVAKNDVKFGLSDRNRVRKRAGEMSLSREHSGGDRRVVIEDSAKTGSRSTQKGLRFNQVNRMNKFLSYDLFHFRACCVSHPKTFSTHVRPVAILNWNSTNLSCTVTASECHAAAITEFFRDIYFLPNEIPSKAC